MFTPNQPQPAPTLGGIQDTFTYRFRSLSVINQQIKIVEDLPRRKPLRRVQRLSKKEGKPYMVNLIRISADGYEADLELYDEDLPLIAIACPKNADNFKGITLAYDGRRWQYICTDNSSNETAHVSQIQVAPDPNAHMNKMVADMQYISKVGTDVTIKVLTNICETIQPGKAVDMIAQAKAQGLIYEQNGVYKVA